MSERWFLSDEEKISHFLAHVRQRAKENRPCTVEFVDKSRTTDQNAIFHALLREISKQKGDESVDEIKRYCKLRFGVPILRGNNEQFRAMYDKAVKHHLSYEEKLEAMDILPVTSMMTKAEMTEMIDACAKHFTDQGLDLTAVELL